MAGFACRHLPAPLFHLPNSVGPKEHLQSVVEQIREQPDASIGEAMLTVRLP